MAGSVPTHKMPAVFVSHGSPMVALQQGLYQDALAAFGRSHSPKAIVVVSAHWGTGTTIEITGDNTHRTIHDFGGFPSELYALTYDAPGSPTLAATVARMLEDAGWKSSVTRERGLDHGAWIPLRILYPGADIPVVALSVPLQFSPEQLYRVGRSLSPLLAEGVLILGSGGIVHNLRQVHFEDRHAAVDPWAAEFDKWFAEGVKSHDHKALFDFAEAAPYARMAVPTFEHFAPVFAVLGAGADSVDVSTIFEGFEHGNISMRSFAIA
jgi:4,5-DOPA dioxygenase extradiol